MQCQKARGMILRWVDGELGSTDQQAVIVHVEDCHSCQQAVAEAKNLQHLLHAKSPALELSPDFSIRFWEKVAERSRLPWYRRVLAEKRPLLLAPRFAQAMAVFILALLLGGVGGFVGAQYGVLPFQSPHYADASFSGFNEYKGLPVASLSGAYLTMVGETVGTTD